MPDKLKISDIYRSSCNISIHYVAELLYIFVPKLRAETSKPHKIFYMAIWQLKKYWSRTNKNAIQRII